MKQSVDCFTDEKCTSILHVYLYYRCAIKNYAECAFLVLSMITLIINVTNVICVDIRYFLSSPWQINLTVIISKLAIFLGYKTNSGRGTITRCSLQYTWIQHVLPIMCVIILLSKEYNAVDSVVFNRRNDSKDLRKIGFNFPRAVSPQNNTSTRHPADSGRKQPCRRYMYIYDLPQNKLNLNQLQCLSVVKQTRQTNFTWQIYVFE